MNPPATRRTPVEHINPLRVVCEQDDVVVEEPLEIRFGGTTVGITMRTPGSDSELALGFLLSEGILEPSEQVDRVDITETEAGLRIVDVVPRRPGPVAWDPLGARRRRSLQSLPRDGRSPAPATMTRPAITRAVQSLTRAQPLFAKTGGSHCAALVRLDGAPVVAFEDVGLDNAVDKVIGFQMFARLLPLSIYALIVTGRVSFDVLERAVTAGVAVVVGLSAASSLAVDRATLANVTLVGFARGESLTLYAGRLGET